MYKIVYNGMYKYIIIKNMFKTSYRYEHSCFPNDACVLFTANELNNAPNSPRRVGGEVVLFPGASTGNVWFAACFSTACCPCLPHPHRCSPHICAAAYFLRYQMLSPSIHAA